MEDAEICENEEDDDKADSENPVRVARTNSPEPIYSAHQTNEGPTSASIISPLGGFGISMSLIYACFSQ